LRDDHASAIINWTDMSASSGSLPLLIQLARASYRLATDDVLGMKLKAYLTLATLRDGKMSQQDLCTTMHMDPNNCVLMLNHLEGTDYVERVRDPADRRRHIVVLTETGREALARAERAMGTLEDEVLGSLTPEEREQFRGLLVRALARDSVAAV
jgi:DNA-binding MarR family transcriptional regulator